MLLSVHCICDFTPLIDSISSCGSVGNSSAAGGRSEDGEAASHRGESVHQSDQLNMLSQQL